MEGDTFKLSVTLGGHEYAVRDIAVQDDNNIATCEERGNVHIWNRRENTREFADRGVSRYHEGLLFCAEYVRTIQFPDGIFVTGGGDFNARPWRVTGERETALIGHTNSVNSISTTSNGQIITGSWDGTAIVWQNGKAGMILRGHEHAVEVVGLQTGEIVAGSASKRLLIYRDGKVVTNIPNAHNFPIKKVVPHPLGFATCGNDGYVKVWTREGRCVVNIASHVDTESKFIYCLAVLPDGALVCGGEDGVVKIWSTDGNLIQSIPHPGPVRAVKVLPNGDIITGCADRVARIFTKDLSRIAGEKELEDFRELCELVKASSGMKELDQSQISDPSVLQQPGKKPGEVRVVNVPGRGAIVYKWDAEVAYWEEFGEALGRSRKTVLNGKEYDHVTDVFVTDDHKIQLGFNRDDDPIEVATNFCAMHNLPPDLRQQVIDHVTPLTDPTLYQLRKLNEQGLAEATALKQTPSWRTGGFETNSECKAKAMQTKLIEFNTALREAGNSRAIQVSESKHFNSLMATIEDRANYHSATMSNEEAAVVRKMMEWPAENLLPVLDAYRVLMCHNGGVDRLGEDYSLQSLLVSHAFRGPVHASLVLKALTNWIAKRKKTPQEKRVPGSISDNLKTFLQTAIPELARFAVNEKGANQAFTMFAYNFITWYGRLEIAEPDLLLQLAPALIEQLKRTLQQTQQTKDLFYILLTLSTLGYSNKAAAEQIVAQAGDVLKTAVKAGKASQNRATQEVAEDLVRVYTLL